MGWERILKSFQRSEIEKIGERVDLDPRNQSAEIRSGEDCEIVHTVAVDPNSRRGGDHYIRVEANLFRDSFDSVRISAFRTREAGSTQTLFRTTTVAQDRPAIQNAHTLGVEVYFGDFSGNGKREVCIMDRDGNVGVFGWNPLT